MRSIILALLVLCIAGNALAQDVTGNLEGRVITADSVPISDVEITISGPALQGVRNLVTDDLGYFRFIAIPVGSYTVRVSHLGYRVVVIAEVRVVLATTTTLGLIQLEVQAIEVAPLLVTARPVVIDPYSTTVGANLETQTIQEVPVERDYQSLLVLLPHANTSYYGDGISVGGNTGSENIFFVDGVKVTSPYKASGSTRFPYNFIKQIEVKEGGYQARYGGALGAIVNVITHSGTNEWETHAFGYFTNSALAADARPGLLDLPENHFATYDVGLRLSGPIKRDRLWFSAAYNPQFQTRDIQALNQGVFDERRTEHRFAAKVNWRMAGRTDVEVSIFGDPTIQHHVGPSRSLFLAAQLSNPDPYLWRSEEGGANLAILARQGLGRTAVIEASLSRSQSDEILIGDTEVASGEPFFHDYTTEGGATSAGGIPWREEVHNLRTAVEASGTLFLGPHTLRIGGRYEENRIDYDVGAPSPGLILKFDENFFLVDSQHCDCLGRRNRIPAFYAQDTWQVDEYLTFNLGLRWDAQYLYGAGDTLAQAFTNQWQPRLGFTIQLGDLGTQKLFGSFGRYYQQRPLYSTVVLFSGNEEIISLYGADPRDPNSSPFRVDRYLDLHRRRDGIEGEYYDEVTFGYERLVGRRVRLVARAINRVLRDAWGAGIDSYGEWVPGNPGKGDLYFLPRPERQYTALELMAEHRGGGPFYFLASYVLSRAYGNYTGLFSTDTGGNQPGINWTFRCAEQGGNSTGLLPSDRTHVVKAIGSYLLGFGLSVGAFFTWQSGTPLNEFGPSKRCIAPLLAPVFLVPRGTAGRTPSTWDLSMRFVYPLGLGGRGTSRLVLDILHIGSQRKVVVVDQLRLLENGEENPTFGAALVHQPPMMVRLGVEVGF